MGLTVSFLRFSYGDSGVQKKANNKRKKDIDTVTFKKELRYHEDGGDCEDDDLHRPLSRLVSLKVSSPRHRLARR